MPVWDVPVVEDGDEKKEEEEVEEEENQDPENMAGALSSSLIGGHLLRGLYYGHQSIQECVLYHVIHCMCSR